jgi:hypothetical protein
MPNDYTEIGRQLTQCILSGDVDSISELYDGDFTAWRNFDNRTLNR